MESSSSSPPSRQRRLPPAVQPCASLQLNLQGGAAQATHVRFKTSVETLRRGPSAEESQHRTARGNANRGVAHLTSWPAALRASSSSGANRPLGAEEQATALQMTTCGAARGTGWAGAGMVQSPCTSNDATILHKPQQPLAGCNRARARHSGRALGSRPLRSSLPTCEVVEQAGRLAAVGSRDAHVEHAACVKGCMQSKACRLCRLC